MISWIIVTSIISIIFYFIGKTVNEKEYKLLRDYIRNLKKEEDKEVFLKNKFFKRRKCLIKETKKKSIIVEVEVDYNEIEPIKK